MISAPERDLENLKYIREYCVNCAKFLDEIDNSRERFFEDICYRDAVSWTIFRASIISEHLSKEFKDAHPKTYWSQLDSLREIIGHNYHDIDWETIWQTAVIIIPEIREFCDQILKNKSKSE